MSRHFLLQSFEVEGASSSWGLPIVAPGQQPTVRRPESYPEYLQTFVTQAEFEALWDRINDIIQKTGFPWKPLVFIFPAVALLPGIIFVGLFPMGFIFFPVGIILCLFGIIYITIDLLPRREEFLEEAIGEWNQRASSRGVYFRLGDESADSLEPAIAQDRFLRNLGDTTNKSMIYLYVDPVARRSWCAKMGVEFLLPPQQNVGQLDLAEGQHQHMESRGALTGSRENSQSTLPPPSYEESLNIH